MRQESPAEAMLRTWSLIEAQIRQLVSDRMSSCAKCRTCLGDNDPGTLWTIFGPVCKNCTSEPTSTHNPQD